MIIFQRCPQLLWKLETWAAWLRIFIVVFNDRDSAVLCVKKEDTVTANMHSNYQVPSWLTSPSKVQEPFPNGSAVASVLSWHENCNSSCLPPAPKTPSVNAKEGIAVAEWQIDAFLKPWVTKSVFCFALLSCCSQGGCGEPLKHKGKNS